MLSRLLKRHGFDEKLIERIQNLSIKTLKQLIVHPMGDMAADLDLSNEEYQQLISKLCHILCPPCTTAYEIYLAQSPTLSTGLSSLDRALQGGIPAASITEFVGLAGTGKTQFCMLLSLMAAASAVDSTVVYVDTEHKFSLKRLWEIATHRFSESRAQQLMDRIQLRTIDSCQDLAQQLSAMDQAIGAQNIKLLVVDSIATLARKEFRTDEIPQRQQYLTKQASLLKYLAGFFNLPVVVTNQATTTESSCRPALGNSWAHCVNTRIVLEKSKLLITKSPVTRHLSIPYEITQAGPTEEEEEAGLEEIVQASGDEANLQQERKMMMMMCG